MIPPDNLWAWQFIALFVGMAVILIALEVVL
jgi:hypothetical protein